MMMAPRARVKLPAQLDRLTTNQLKELIKQSHLGREDERIAKVHLIDLVPLVDVGAEVNLSPSTISRRKRHIIKKLLAMMKTE